MSGNARHLSQSLLCCDDTQQCMDLDASCQAVTCFVFNNSVTHQHMHDRFAGSSLPEMHMRPVAARASVNQQLRCQNCCQHGRDSGSESCTSASLAGMSRRLLLLMSPFVAHNSLFLFSQWLMQFLMVLCPIPWQHPCVVHVAGHVCTMVCHAERTCTSNQLGWTSTQFLAT